MEGNMLAFITEQMKESELTVDTLVKSVDGLSRQKFYRFCGEPERFSSDQLDQIATTLKLSVAQREQLFNFGKQESLQSDIEPLIMDIIFYPSPIVTDKTIMEFNYYEHGMNGVIKWPASLLAGHITEDRIIPRESTSQGTENKQPPKKNNSEQSIHHNFTCTIYNCISNSVLSSLARLFYSFQQHVESPHTVHLKIKHYVGRIPESNKKKLEMLKNLAPLISMFNDYNYYTDVFALPIWTKSNNFCSIKYSQTNEEKKKGHRYYLINVTDHGRLHVASLGNNSTLYEYFTLDTRGRNPGQAINEYNALSANMFQLNLRSTCKGINVLWTLCVDTVKSAPHWMIMNKDRTTSKIKELLGQILDPQGFFDGLPIEQKLKNAIDVINRRFELSESMGTINLIYALGLDEFAKNRYTSDFDVLVPTESGEKVPLGSLITFNRDEVKEQLVYIKDRLGSQNAGQSFYLIRPMNKLQSNSLCLYKNALIYLLCVDNREKLSHASSFRDVETANMIYSFITDRLIPNCGNYDSILMGKNEAATYINSVIDKWCCS